MHVRSEPPRTSHHFELRAVLPRRILLSAAVSASAGVLAGWWIPRGPVTTTQAVLAVLLGLGAGFASGRLLGSRWALLLAPATRTAGVAALVLAPVATTSWAAVWTWAPDLLLLLVLLSVILATTAAIRLALVVRRPPVLVAPAIERDHHAHA